MRTKSIITKKFKQAYHCCKLREMAAVKEMKELGVKKTTFYILGKETFPFPISTPISVPITCAITAPGPSNGDKVYYINDLNTTDQIIVVNR